MTPRPPFWAMAMAMRASVTVSMAEAMIGMLRRMVLVSWVDDVDVAGQDLGAAGPQQHVIEGQAFDDLIGEYEAMTNSLKGCADATITLWRVGTGP